jgi:hypothetical protein
MRYQEIRKESEKKRNQLINDCNVFFAFSNEQFAEGKKNNPIAEGEKYVSIGAGGYMPKSKYKLFSDGLDNINKWEKSEIKKVKENKEKHILFELRNHECFYIGDINDVIHYLPYNRKDIQQVFNKYKTTEIQY